MICKISGVLTVALGAFTFSSGMDVMHATLTSVALGFIGMFIFLTGFAK